MAEPAITVVTVTYNAKSTLKAHLESLKPAHEAGLIRVVVSDNASPDGTADLARASAPWVEVLGNGGNLGFARGCNAGFDRVDTEYVLFLNPDTVVPLEAIRSMLEFLRSNPKAGMVGPAMRYPAGQLQYAGMELTPTGVLAEAAGLVRWAFPTGREIKPGEDPFRTNWLCGACMLLPTRVYREVGMMDPRFFLYFEETDLCRKLGDNGYELWALGEAVIEHEGGAATSQSGQQLYENCIAEFFFASRYYYLSKNFGSGAATACEIGELAILAGRTAVNAALRRDGNLLRRRLAGPVLRPPPA